MFEWIALGITVIILVLLIIKKPFWLVPLLAVALALEISTTWYPSLGIDLGTDQSIVGKLLGMLSLAKLIGIALILAAFSRLLLIEDMKRKLSAVFSAPLTIILMIFVILGAASIVYSFDTGTTVVASIRLLALFAIFLSIALFMDKKHALVPFQAVHLTAMALAPLSFYEGFTGNLIWQSEQLLGDTMKVNATFVDPNIFARFIILGIVANFVLQLYTRDKSTGLLYMAGLAILIAQLALISVLSGILTLIVILIATLIFLPNRKAVLWVLGLGGLCGAMVLIVRPDLWEGMLLLTQNFGVQEIIALFQNHPIFGTGLGTSSLSNISVVIIGTELGILGLIVLAVLWLILFGGLYSLYSLGNNQISIFNNYFNEYYVGVGYFLWALTVFISSQSGGVFFEDPILWLSCACLVMLRFTREYNTTLESF